MAAATIKQGAHRIFGGHHRSSNKSDPVDVEQREKEKQVITDFLDQRNGIGARGGTGSPAGLARVADQRLGLSSRQLGIKDFKLLKTLGTGTFARVWLSSLAGSNSEKDKGKVFALKILRKADSKIMMPHLGPSFRTNVKGTDVNLYGNFVIVIRLKQVEHIRNERSTLAAVNGHPFITTMITTFSDRDCLYMLLDYCPGGEVFTYLRRARRFDEETSRFYAAEIVLILEFLHDQHGIAYRDLKPENILLDAEGHLKLVDFGFAKHIGHKETYTLCGTPEYLAPEVIKNSGHGTAVDWWAFGILLYEFLVGQPPFWDSNPLRIYELIVEAQPQYPNTIPATARDLISKLLAPNPSHRLGNISGGIGAIKSHEFFEGVDWKSVYERRKRGPILPQLKNKGEGAECFDEYDPPSDKEKGEYTKEMMGKWEHEFKDF